MRAYFFGNMYLSSIQQGIQAAHVTAELFCQYDGEEVYDGIQTPTGVLTEWANDHKTMILLNGGYLETMEDLWYFLDYTTDKPYPYAKFHEGLDSLGGVLTSIGIVLPEKIYLTAAAMRRDRPARGEMSIADIIQTTEKWVVYPENKYGFVLEDGEESRVFEFTKWEFELMNRLNEFNLAS